MRVSEFGTHLFACMLTPSQGWRKKKDLDEERQEATPLAVERDAPLKLTQGCAALKKCVSWRDEYTDCGIKFVLIIIYNEKCAP